MSDCIFCKIAAGEIPSNKVYEDELCFAFYDIAPQAPTHFLVIPKAHIPSCGAVTAENSAVVAHIFEVIAKVTKAGTAAEGAAEGAGLFGTAMGGPVAIGVAAAAIALGAAISAIGEYEEHQAAVRDATSGLVTAMDSAQTAHAVRDVIPVVQLQFHHRTPPSHSQGRYSLPLMVNRPLTSTFPRSSTAPSFRRYTAFSPGP